MNSIFYLITTWLSATSVHNKYAIPCYFRITAQFAGKLQTVGADPLYIHTYVNE